MTPTEGSQPYAMEKEIRFYGSLGTQIVADLYRPERERANGWSIVVCPGYGSIKELMEGWGRALAESGFLVLVVGYTGYGRNPGHLGRIFPQEHVDDARSAMRWIRNQAGSARLAVLGVSYGGAVAFQSGAEESADAVISIVGYGSGARHLRALRRHGEWLELLERVREDRSKRVVSGESEVISLNEILLRDEEAQAWRERVESEFPGMRFDVTVESVDRLIEFEPEKRLPLPDGTPLLIIHAEKDSIIPREEVDSVLARARDPKRLVVLSGAEHHAVHEGKHFETCINEIDSFLRGVYAEV